MPGARQRVPAYDLTTIFDEPKYEYFTGLIDLMVQEDPNQRLPTAEHIIPKWEEARARFQKAINCPSPTLRQRCIYCGIGTYEPVDRSGPDGGNSDHNVEMGLGIAAYQDSRFRVMPPNSLSHKRRIARNNASALARDEELPIINSVQTGRNSRICHALRYCRVYSIRSNYKCPIMTVGTKIP